VIGEGVHDGTEKRPIRGEVLLKGILALEVPEEMSCSFVVYAMEGGVCRAVYERDRVFSSFTLPSPTMEAVMAAIIAITPPPSPPCPQDAPDDAHWMRQDSGT
jgi:hypothetical protein